MAGERRDVYLQDSLRLRRLICRLVCMPPRRYRRSSYRSAFHSVSYYDGMVECCSLLREDHGRPHTSRHATPGFSRAPC